MDSLKQAPQPEQPTQHRHGSRRTPGAMPTLSQLLCDEQHASRNIYEPANEPPNEPANGSENPAGSLTRHNLKALNTERRRATARRRGRSTRSPSPDLHSYCETPTTADLPPLILNHNPPKRTSASIAYSLESYQRWREKQASRPVPPKPSGEWAFGGVRPDRPDAMPSQPPQSPPPENFALMSGNGGTHSDRESPLNQPPAEGMSLLNPGGFSFCGYPPPQFPPPPKSSTPPPRPPMNRPDIPRQQTAADPPGLPSSFPAYHCTNNMNEIAAYLANASYVTALGGPPLADLKYGIIIVPAGEESLLFGPKSTFVIDQAFVDAVDDAKRDHGKALRMHDPDKDSEEFVRHRFDDDFPSVSGREQKNVETIIPSREMDEVPGGVDGDSAAEDVEAPRGKRQRRAPRQLSSGRKATPSTRAGSNGRAAAKAAVDKSRPQGVSKPKRSTRATEVLSPSQPAVKRTLRGRK